MNKILVTSLDKRFKKFERKIKLAAQKILKILGKNNVLVEIYLINSQKMRFLNKKFRLDKTRTNADKAPLFAPTILSFEEPRNFIYPHTKRGLVPSAQKCYLSSFGAGVYPKKYKKIGEIYLNIANSKLKTQNSKLYYLTHGLLHLFGYNHKKKNDRIRMEQIERLLIERFKD